MSPGLVTIGRTDRHITFHIFLWLLHQETWTNGVSVVICPSGIWRSPYQVLHYAAWAGRSVLQSQHGSGHTSAGLRPEGGGDGRGARSKSFTLYVQWLFSVIDFKDPKCATCVCASEPSLPPQLPPRNFNDVKENDSFDQSCKSLSDTYLMRLQHMDLST